ncbi:glutaredoxin-like protein C5orf63 homolog isoform X2 [Prionailurus iriomotensis]
MARRQQDPCPLCDEAKEVLEAYKNRVTPVSPSAIRK